ncbi:hypothetical protein OG470_02145 [Micromonospora sp. NBC_00389]
MVIVQAGLGLRLGELLALRVQDVDHLARTVRIEWQFAPQSKVRTEPKTRRSLRRPVPARLLRLADLLGGCRAGRATEGHHESSNESTA